MTRKTPLEQVVDAERALAAGDVWGALKAARRLFTDRDLQGLRDGGSAEERVAAERLLMVDVIERTCGGLDGGPASTELARSAGALLAFARRWWTL